MNKFIITTLILSVFLTLTSVASEIKRQDLTSNRITLHGWAEEFNERQIKGLTGHPGESGFPYNTDMWVGYMDKNDRELSQFGAAWWPYEQTAYYLDGALRVGYMAKSKPLLNRVRANIRYVLNHAYANGQLHAGNTDPDSWPMVVFMRLLIQEYRITGDAKLLDAMEKHYHAVYQNEKTSYAAEQETDRADLHVEILCELFKITGNSWFLKKAESIYKGIKTNGHAVTFHEFLKLPAILYSCTGKARYREDFEKGFTLIHETHELADGLSSGTEALAGKGPDKAHELCNVIDFNWACGWALIATGDALYADKMEKVLYNAGFSSITSDFKAHQYYGGPNIPASHNTSSHYNDKDSWGCFAQGRMTYRPGHDTECCSGNMHRMFPTFLNRMCLIEKDAVSIVFYLPSTIEIPVRGEQLKITQTTLYPFEHEISIAIEAAPKKAIALRLRIPAWVKGYKITVNGELTQSGIAGGIFAELKQVFKSNDKIQLSFEAEPVIDDRGRGLAVNYGPLVFSLPVVAATRKLTTSHPAGKASPAFPAYQLFPSTNTSWAVALPAELNAGQIKVQRSPKNDYPWNPGKSPVKLTVPGRAVTNWKLQNGRYAPDFPDHIETESAEKTFLLEPMGSTLLRITEFPKFTR